MYTETSNEIKAILMEPNDYQVGGRHYKVDYEHWDFVHDTQLPYVLGCATKYIFRWRSKNGVEDLKKALHYISKAEDLGLFGRTYVPRWSKKSDYIKKFLGQCVERKDASIISHICHGNPEAASREIHKLIEGENKNVNNL